MIDLQAVAQCFRKAEVVQEELEKGVETLAKAFKKENILEVLRSVRTMEEVDKVRTCVDVIGLIKRNCTS